MDSRDTERLNQKRTDPVERYREYVEFQLVMDGEGLSLREARESLALLTGIDAVDYQELDEQVIGAIVVEDEIAPYLLEDDPAQPLEKWWWHLGAIRNRAYPLELLPEHLREWAS